MDWVEEERYPVTLRLGEKTFEMPPLTEPDCERLGSEVSAIFTLTRDLLRRETDDAVLRILTAMHVPHREAFLDAAKTLPDPIIRPPQPLDRDPRPEPYPEEPDETSSLRPDPSGSSSSSSTGGRKRDLANRRRPD